jgi:hypothetical protein
MAQIPQGRRVARDTFADAILAHTCCPFRPNSNATFTNPKRQSIGPAQIVMVAGPARDIAVPGQDFIIEKELTDFGLCWIEGEKILCRDGQLFGDCGGGKEKGDEQMKYIVAVLMVLALPAWSEIEEARDLMEAGRFEEARKALWPAARSGNADAEELIGVMYALGLGVERDPERAFDWYLRSALKGHPGAQSGVGWYYEVGLGMPAPDLTRAYMWYVLSAIGGDPDAAISMEEVVKKMTAEQIEKAHIMVEDYRVWMYPFR